MQPSPRNSPGPTKVIVASFPFAEVTVTLSRKIYLVSADGGAPRLLLSGEFQPADPSWSPDGQSIAYGGVPSVEKSRAVRTEIGILDLNTKQSRTITGSQGFFSPRWSLDGRYIAAISEDMVHLWLYSFASNRWTPLPVPRVPDRLGIGWPVWSHDSRYLYFMNGLDIYKIRVPGGSLEFVSSASGLDIRSPAIRWENWFALTPDDRPHVLIDRCFDELYALDLDYR